MKYFQILKKRLKRREKNLKKVDLYFSKLKAVAKKIDKNSKVYLFGSFLEREKFTARSDIDILVKMRKINLNERPKILVKIRKALNFNPLFQIHLVDENGFKWYRRFIRKMKEI